MKSNRYTGAVNAVRATDTFKNRTMEAMANVAACSSDVSKKRATRPFAKWIAVAATFVLICGLGIWGGIKIFNTPIDNDYPPGFMVNDSMFWYAGLSTDIFDTLPDGYVKIGVIKEIVSNKEGVDYKNFQSGFGNVGDQIFMHPEKPDAACLYTDMFSEKGDYHYILFVTRDLQSRMVFYNSKLYHVTDETTNKLWEQNSDYHLVGTIQKTIFDMIPSIEFQSNIQKSFGCNVYASEKTPEVIYLEFPEANDSYHMELRVQ